MTRHYTARDEEAQAEFLAWFRGISTPDINDQEDPAPAAPVRSPATDPSQGRGGDHGPTAGESFLDMIQGLAVSRRDRTRNTADFMRSVKDLN